MYNSLLKRWNDFAIGTRLTVGMTATLFLTILVGFVGLSTIKSQTLSQTFANQAIELITDLNRARKDEKNFMLTGSHEYAKKTLFAIEKLKKKSDNLRGLLTGESKNILILLEHEIDKYRKEFKNFVRLDEKKENALQVMVIQGRALEKTAVLLSDDQKKELQRLEKISVKSSNEREEKSEKADDANRIIKLMGEARQQEKNFLLRNQKRYAQETKNLVNQLIVQAKSTKLRFEDKENQSLADSIIKTAKKYLYELDIVVSGKERSNKVHHGMIQLARAVEEGTTFLRKDQKKELIRLEEFVQNKKTNPLIRQDKRDKVDVTNRIIKLMAETRQQEKNFLLRKEQAYAEVTISLVNEMLEDVQKLQKSFLDKDNQALAQKIIDAGEKYREEFGKLVQITNENSQSQDLMASLGRQVEERASKLRSDQKQELKRLEKISTLSAQQRLKKRIKADIANRIIRLMSEARQQEKNFLLRHENAYVEVTRSFVSKAVRQAQLLKDSFADNQNRSLTNKITAAAEIYLQEFENVVLAEKEQSLQLNRMIVAARAIENMAHHIRNNTQEEALNSRQKATTIILFSITLSLILGIIATLLLTKSIVNPIKQLVIVINKLAREDDVDIPFVQKQDELGQIARAISDFKDILLKRKEKTEAQLIQAEKMSALGDLVAGVAHEINTPIGIAVTGSTHLKDQITNLEIAFDAGKLRKNEFKMFIENAVPTADTIQSNLQRASALIKSFKQVAVDQSSQERRVFRVVEYIQEVIISLRPRLKQYKHTIEVNGDKQLFIDTVPGALSQIITNLLMNSLTHAFEDKKEGKITIDVGSDESMLFLSYRDNGKGIDKTIQQRVFEPFFTTKRGSGGSGLGLSIVYNLVTQTMGGEIECISDIGNGTIFEMKLPLKNNMKNGNGNGNGNE